MMPKLDVVNVVSILISAQARPGASLAAVVHSSVRQRQPWAQPRAVRRELNSSTDWTGLSALTNQVRVSSALAESSTAALGGTRRYSAVLDGMCWAPQLDTRVGQSAQQSRLGSASARLGSARLGSARLGALAPQRVRLGARVREGLRVRAALTVRFTAHLAQFLGMEPLVAQCLEYVVANINEILRMPIDLNCLNSQLIDQLGQSTKLYSELQSSAGMTTAAEA